MEETINKLQRLMADISRHIDSLSSEEINRKPSPQKWSKKEIMGHLIDSAMNNIQRFTEIQFVDLPYQVRQYNQDALVKSNAYQLAEIEDIEALWLALNVRVVSLISHQDAETLKRKVKLPNGENADLRFLMVDYVDHMEHHMHQIIYK